MKTAIITACNNDLNFHINHQRTNKLRLKLINLGLGFCGGIWNEPNSKRVCFVVEYEDKKELNKIPDCEIIYTKGLTEYQGNPNYLEYNRRVYEIK